MQKMLKHNRLTRDEAAAVIYGMLKDVPLPFDYRGGLSQILSDLVCLSPRTLRNMAYKGRKTIVSHSAEQKK